jgi:uncharacterized protein YbaR (Trm112 family)/SAM-dependent methyltransferase
MNRNLFELLACPECGSADLALLPGDTLACPSCAGRYPIINGIPHMLPAHLAATLRQKNDYLKRLMTATSRGNDLSNPNNPELDRFMWEHHLYNWGKHVIYSDSKAAEIFAQYAEKGAQVLCRFLQERAGGVYGKRLLYVGSGNDRLVSLPLEQAGAFMVNLDVVSDPLEDLMAAGAQNCVCGDIRQLPFRAEAFDVVFSKGSLHHSQPIAEPLGAMVGVVKREGHIVIAEPNSYMFLPRFTLPGGLGHPTPYENALSRRQVARILAKDGVHQLHFTALTYAPPGTPAPLANLWKRLGQAMPWLFDRFAFEFILHGKRGDGVE